MEITEVRIKLVENGNERLRAFCSITLDGDFVIRDLKVIDGANGPFVAMPSRKLMDRCPRCGAKNHLRSRFCNECGAKLNENRAPKDPQGRAKLHADVAHPINAGCRERVQKAVVEAYHAELERAKAPDYKPAKFDDYEDFDEDASYSDRGEQAGPRRPNGSAGGGRQPEARSPAGDDQGEDTFGDYNALIADLKREAEQRRGDRPSNRSSEPTAPQQAYEPPPPPPRPQPKPAAPPPQPARSMPSGRPSTESDDAFGQGL